MGGERLGCGSVVGYSGVVRLSCFGVGGRHVNFLFHGGAPSLVANGGGGFWRGFIVSFFWWGFGGERVGRIGTHETMGCMMSIWCGIIFMWG